MDTVSDPFRPTIRTQADLERVWRHLMQPLGFSRSTVWMLLVDADDRPHSQLVELEDCPARPEPDSLAGLAEMAGIVLADHPGGRWAFLRSRPGGATVTDADRLWGRGIVEACRVAGVPTEVVHLATDADVVPLPYDALSAGSAA